MGHFTTLAELAPHERLLAMHLIGKYLNRASGTAWPTQKRLAREFDVRRPTVSDWIAGLVRAKRIQVSRNSRFSGNEYQFLWCRDYEPLPRVSQTVRDVSETVPDEVSETVRRSSDFTASAKPYATLGNTETLVGENQQQQRVKRGLDKHAVAAARELILPVIRQYEVWNTTAPGESWERELVDVPVQLFQPIAESIRARPYRRAKTPVMVVRKAVQDAKSRCRPTSTGSNQAASVPTPDDTSLAPELLVHQPKPPPPLHFEKPSAEDRAAAQAERAKSEVDKHLVEIQKMLARLREKPSDDYTRTILEGYRQDPEFRLREAALMALTTVPKPNASEPGQQPSAESNDVSDLGPGERTPVL